MTKNNWHLSRVQKACETVSNYVASMQGAETRIGMDERALTNPPIKGLRSEIRLFVLHNKLETIHDVLETAWTSETAHMAEKQIPDPMSNMTALMQQLLLQMIHNNDREMAKQQKTVSFTEQHRIWSTISRTYISSVEDAVSVAWSCWVEQLSTTFNHSANIATIRSREP